MMTVMIHNIHNMKVMLVMTVSDKNADDNCYEGDADDDCFGSDDLHRRALSFHGYQWH